jgi:hypothetical protein
MARPELFLSRALNALNLKAELNRVRKNALLLLSLPSRYALSEGCTAPVMAAAAAAVAACARSRAAKSEDPPAKKMRGEQPHDKAAVKVAAAALGVAEATVRRRAKDLLGALGAMERELMPWGGDLTTDVEYILEHLLPSMDKLEAAGVVPTSTSPAPPGIKNKSVRRVVKDRVRLRGLVAQCRDDPLGSGGGGKGCDLSFLKQDIWRLILAGKSDEEVERVLCDSHGHDFLRGGEGGDEDEEGDDSDVDADIVSMLIGE